MLGVGVVIVIGLWAAIGFFIWRWLSSTRSECWSRPSQRSFPWLCARCLMARRLEVARSRPQLWDVRPRPLTGFFTRP